MELAIASTRRERPATVPGRRVATRCCRAPMFVLVAFLSLPAEPSLPERCPPVNCRGTCSSHRLGRSGPPPQAKPSAALETAPLTETAARLALLRPVGRSLPGPPATRSPKGSDRTAAEPSPF